MLTAVRNQIRITLLTTKYAIVREMLNKTTFLMNIIFMILNDASFIIQWIVLYSIKDGIGGYTFKQVLLLWGLAAGTFGFSRFFFYKAFSLSDVINNGKLDSYLVQPKNVLLSAITSDVSTSALGDLFYGYLMAFIYECSFSNILLFTFFIITGGVILVSVSVILSSLSFWFQKADMIAETGDSLMTNFATYPDGIFKGAVKVLFYTLLPVGFVNYIPVQLLNEFNLEYTVLVFLVALSFVILAFIVFYRGLHRYSSSNLMISKI